MFVLQNRVETKRPTIDRPWTPKENFAIAPGTGKALPSPEAMGWMLPSLCIDFINFVSQRLARGKPGCSMLRFGMRIAQMGSFARPV